MKILNFNVQSIRNKSDIIGLFLEQEEVDVACFSEHWLSAGETVNWPGYKTANIFNRASLGGGVAIYAKNTLTTKPIDEIQGLNNPGIIELTAAVIESLNTVVVTIYRPPNGNFQDFVNNFETAIKIACSRGETVVIAGDFNVHFQRESDARRQQLSDLIGTYNLQATFNDPSRVTATTASCLDNILTNRLTYETATLNAGVSDHLAQMLSLPISSSQQVEGRATYRRNFKKTNVEMFADHLANQDWNSVYAADGADNKCRTFMKAIQALVEVCFPITLMKSRPTKNFYREIKNKFLQESVNLRDLKVIAQNSLDEEFKDNYRKYRHCFTKCIRYLKSQQIGDEIAEAPNKAKKIWQVVSRETKPQSKTQQEITLKEGGNTISNPADVAKTLNDYFIESAAEITASLPPCTTNIGAEPGNTTHSFFLDGVTPIEVEQLCKKLKNKRTAGVDELPINILKAAGPALSSPLAHVINASFSEGHFCDVLKRARVIAIHKKGSRQEKQNWRPISVLPAISKIFEGAFTNRLVHYLESKKLLQLNQFGFRKGRSCESAITAIVNDVLLALDSKKSAIGLLCDVRKAFDSIQHQDLLRKLKKVGVRGQPYDWIASFLSNREQVTEVPCPDGSFARSPWKKVELGLPQGALLSPILFLIYIDGILPHLQSDTTTPYVYADDCNAIVVGNKANAASDTTETTRKAYDWLNQNRLSLSIEKTQVISFISRGGTADEISIDISGEQIRQVEECSFLGVILDSKLNWKSHVNVVCSKVSRSCYALKQLRGLLTRETLITIYHAIVESHLSYGVNCWGGSSAAIRAFRMQKRAIRIICGKCRTHPCRPLFKELKLLTQPALYIQKCILQTRRNLGSYQRNADIHQHNTRGANNLALQPIRLEATRQSPRLAGIKFYNALPQAIREEDSFKSFAGKVKEHLLGKIPYSTEDFF